MHSPRAFTKLQSDAGCSTLSTSRRQDASLHKRQHAPTPVRAVMSSVPRGVGSKHSEGVASHTCCGITALLKRSFWKMVELFSADFWQRWPTRQVLRKLSLQAGRAAAGLHTTGRTSAMQKAVASTSVVLASLQMMLEAADGSVATRRTWKRHVRLVPSWHGPEDSEVSSLSEQFGQFGACMEAVAPANLG